MFPWRVLRKEFQDTGVDLDEELEECCEGEGVLAVMPLVKALTY